MLKIRKNTPISIGSWRKPANLLIKRDCYKGRNVSVIDLTLTPTGCEWAKTGGCTMCGEWSGSRLGKKVDAKYHISQFATGVANIIPKTGSPWLRIYQEGSFMNNAEFDNLAQATILRLASLIKGIERVTIEGRAQYIKDKKIKELKEAIIPPVELEVGIGFEAQDELIRMVCVNKGLVKKHLYNAVNSLRKYGVRSLAYVLLKPPFVSEKEAIDEAVATIKEAFRLGFDSVSLEPLSVHPWSLVEALYLKGLYKPPWLWSIVEVINQTDGLGEIRIGGCEYYPPPEVVSRNYHKNSNSCSKRVLESLKEYNISQDINVFNSFTCKCRADWENGLESKQDSLKTRINRYLGNLSIDKYIRYKLDGN
ncbi:MAG: archaeosine biosynthesis radical SAM protein RaSEA [Patescibacteria group bacterium]